MKALPAVTSADTQPSLFRPGELPELDESEHQLAKEFIHTGKITSKNAPLVAAITATLLANQGNVADTARTCHVGWHTVKRIRSELVLAGKLDEQGRRILKKAGDLKEDAIDLLHSRIKTGAIESGTLVVALEKVSSMEEKMMGLPDTHEARPMVDFVDPEEWCKRVEALVIDVQSTAQAAQSPDDQAPTSGPDPVGCPPPAPAPAGSAPSRSRADDPSREGGGGAAPGGGGFGDCSDR